MGNDVEAITKVSRAKDLLARLEVLVCDTHGIMEF